MSVQKLTIICGPANSGKMPLARMLIHEDPKLCCVHRDDIRKMLRSKVDESHITIIMKTVAMTLLSKGYSVIVVAWNLEPFDKITWDNVYRETNHRIFPRFIEYKWLDTTLPEVKSMIPPIPQFSDDETLDASMRTQMS